MRSRKFQRLKEKVSAFLLLSALIAGIGIVGHMDAQDARAKAEGPQAYFTE